MNYWLVKFASFRCSWEDILRNGKFEIYSVRSPQERNNLKLMRISDEVLFYHSQEGNCIMGKMKVIEEAHQDKTTADNRWLSVTFEPIETYEKPVPLSIIKTFPKLNQTGLIKQPRVAVHSLLKEDFDLMTSLLNFNPVFQ